MDFEWDEAKSSANLDRQRPAFTLAAALIEGPTVEEIDDRRDYGELRIKAIGLVAEVHFVCIYADRGDVRRIISLRQANRKESDGYRSFLSK